ncbi:hypothetical protein [Paenibacillus hamazuiensis]|uniref:hypothetical protein n=1 Tax=Paenibacillus hamazuiensis TaxID=2936508 RepID=UPI00201087DE|nr:hypothetical protein [Paenibacillus hamazuiensis]
MFILSCTNWSFDHGLQIIHADVKMEADGAVLIEEPLCVDVGLPALLLSGLEDTDSNRWASPEEWRKMPFFCCGCGDPECRAFSFRVRHDGDFVRLTELEERPDREPRELFEAEIAADEYRREILQAGRQFLRFIEGLDYRPYYGNTVSEVKQLIGRLEEAVRKI